MKRKTTINDTPSFFHEIYSYGYENEFPKIMITGGIHGDEVSGIYVAESLVEYFNKHKVKKGFVKIIPRCNPTATRQMKRKSFYDDLDMNRIFPGDEKASTTRRAANNIWNESDFADIIIDLHCCNQSSMMYALAIYDEFPAVEELIKSLNIQNLIQSEGVEGQLFTESCRKRGQKAFIIELPSGRSAGAVNFAAAEECFNAILNLFIHEGLIEGNYIDNPPKSFGKIKDITSKENGLWIPNVSNGQEINKGDVIGNINGIDIAAPEIGTVLITIPGSYVFVGDNVLSYV